MISLASYTIGTQTKSSSNPKTNSYLDDRRQMVFGAAQADQPRAAAHFRVRRPPLQPGLAGWILGFVQSQSGSGTRIHRRSTRRRKVIRRLEGRLSTAGIECRIWFSVRIMRSKSTEVSTNSSTSSWPWCGMTSLAFAPSGLAGADDDVQV